MSKKHNNGNVATENTEVEVIEQDAQEVTEAKEEVGTMKKVMSWLKGHLWILIVPVAIIAALAGIKIGKDKKAAYDPVYGYGDDDADDAFEADCTEADTDVEDAATSEE